jgi:pyruvate dehydrogenase E2 component (dihydrolipoamide acetyltransferase)
MGRKDIANPHAKKLAKQHRVDLAKVTGTRTYDQITLTGIEAAARIKV